MVNVDSGQIGQVIQNIVINARHAMPEGGRIDIRCDNVEDAESAVLVADGEQAINSYRKLQESAHLLIS